MFALLSSVTAPKPYSHAVLWPHLFVMGCVCVISIILTCQVPLERVLRLQQQKQACRQSFHWNLAPSRVSLPWTLCFCLLTGGFIRHLQSFWMCLQSLKISKLFCQEQVFIFSSENFFRMLCVANGLMEDLELGPQSLEWAQLLRHT